MSNLRFAIIKSVKCNLGNYVEDVVFEYDQEKIFKMLKERLDFNLENKKVLSLKSKRSMVAINNALKKSWNDVIEEFKKVTVRIF